MENLLKTTKVAIKIFVVDNTPRVDSRLIATRLDIEHHNVIGNIQKYSNEFKQLGILPFKTEEIKGRGQPECAPTQIFSPLALSTT